MRLHDIALLVVYLRQYQQKYGLDKSCGEALNRVDWEITALKEAQIESEDYEIGEPLVPITVDHTGRGDA